MGWRRPPNRLNSYNAPESQRVDAAGEWRKKDMILTWEGLTDMAGAVKLAAMAQTRFIVRKSAEAIVLDGL